LLYLTFHDHNILVKCKESTLLQKLKEEFHFFIGKSDSFPEITIELKIETSPKIPSLVAHKILDNSISYRIGDLQYLDYFGEALTIRNSDNNLFTIYSLSNDRLYELAFLTIHSVIGQTLERSGFCRIHAAAISMNQFNAIIMLPSKGGKSTLLKELITNEKVKIISDDMPISNLSGEIYPFPSKLSFDQIPASGPLSKIEWREFKRHSYPSKWTASLSSLKEKIDGSPMRNQNILIAGFRLSNGESILSPVNKFLMFKPILEHMVVGLGLPQIIEIFLNFDWRDYIKLPIHFAIRSISAFNLIRKSKCYYFYMGQDIQKNAHLILELMHDNQNS
jgi:hypothetical protein